MTKNLVVGPGTSFFICYDVNGLLTNTHDAALHPLPGVREALHILKKENVKKVLVSGWDIASLVAFRDRRLELSNLSIVGEHGAVWEQGGRIHEINPIAQQQVLAMKEAVFRGAAQEQLKVAIQGNVSSRVTGLFFEAEGQNRGNLAKHILVEGSEVSIHAIFDELKKEKGFRFVDGKILFSPNQSTIQEFDRVLRTVFPLRSVRLALEKDDIAFWIDTEDRADYTIKDMKIFLKKVLSDSWNVMIHDDFGADIMFQAEPEKKITKESTSYLLSEKIFGGQPHIVTNVGDRPSDVFVGDRSIFFAQKDTEAEIYCRKNNIPHVIVKHGGDYSLILAALLRI